MAKSKTKSVAKTTIPTRNLKKIFTDILENYGTERSANPYGSKNIITFSNFFQNIYTDTIDNINDLPQKIGFNALSDSLFLLGGTGNLPINPYIAFRKNPNIVSRGFYPIIHFNILAKTVHFQIGWSNNNPPKYQMRKRVEATLRNELSRKGVSFNDEFILLTLNLCDLDETKNPCIESTIISNLQKMLEVFLETYNKHENEIKEWIIPSNTTTIPSDSKEPLNTILYGPPGTGKTYNTKHKAWEIIKGIAYDKDKDKYKGLIANNQINFITFHQSYSYEQFIEGLTVKSEGKDAIYEIKDGIFKQICDNAKYEWDTCKENLIEEAKKKLKEELKISSNTDKNDDVKKDNENKSPNVTNEDIAKICPRFVLIIDEINRGNISKIFGELITLLEPDKRLGAENEIIVELPYSNDKFGIPPNLYIIGTMNTADRSLIHLDVALRRRFAFEEMMPKYINEINWEKNGKLDFNFTAQIINGNVLHIISENNIETIINGLTETHFGILNLTQPNTHFDLSTFLQELNKKIKKQKSRDYQIGHAYLMKVKSFEELKFAWCQQIMPLLQEYFYNDLEGLSKVIGDKSEFLNKDEEDFELNINISDKFLEEFIKVYCSVIFLLKKK